MNKFILPSNFVTCTASTPKLRCFSIVEFTRHSRSWPLQINPLDSGPDLPSLFHKVHKVFPRNLALVSQLARFLLFNLQLLDIVLQADAEIVRRVLECAPNFSRDAGAVGVNVIECGQLDREFL